MSLESALLLESGAELLKFDLRKVKIGYREYTVLTGYERTPGICFWCGEKLKGRLKRYCYGHMTPYYRHFEWGRASRWAKERAGHRCENCGVAEIGWRRDQWEESAPNLEVHHIVPLNGHRPQFSAYHLPWNLVALCHKCHLEIGAILRGPPASAITKYDQAVAKGQLSLV